MCVTHKYHQTEMFFLSADPPEEEVGRQHQGLDRPGDHQVPEGSGEQGKWRKLVVKSTVVPQPLLRLRDR